MSQEIRRLSTLLSALADPNRLRILKCLQVRKACVCELVQALDMPQPRVSRHLKWLRDAGLVLDSRDAQWVEYSLAPAPKGSPEAALLELVGQALKDCPQARRDRKRLKASKREAPMRE